VSHGDSVTIWIEGIKAGDNADIQRLWDRYFRRLSRLAGARLPASCRRAFDEEDVALSAFRSFCERAGQGEFPRMNDREDLWRLMATITVRKALGKMRHQTRQKRGGGHVLGESALTAGEDRPRDGLAEVLGEEPTPDAVAQFAEDYERLLAKLVDPELLKVAVRRLEGQTTREIAAASKVSTKTIERKLKLIRTIWSQESRP
jgi:DNA-directed RNA polymerase specialized sigma24 family protein